jgi:coronin-7
VVDIFFYSSLCGIIHISHKQILLSERFWIFHTMSSFVRESKLRQMSVALSGRENHYEQLKISNVASDNNSLAANDRFLAYIDSGGGGSAVAVLPLSSVGKNHIPTTAPTYQQPLIRAHSQAVTDLCFNPFNSQQLYTCAGDKSLKLWSIPTDGYIVDAIDSTSVISHGNSLREILPHISVAGLTACRGVIDIPLFDIEIGSSIRSVEGFSNELQSLCWSSMGDILCCTTKDKNICLADLRSQGIVASAAAHANHRTSRVAWMGDSPYALSCAFSAVQDREVALWDSRRMESPVSKQRIDTSTGTLIPIYDADLNFIVLVGKGDTSVRVFEFQFSDSSDGILHPVCNVPLGDMATTKGAAVMPKQTNDLMGCEVLRVLRLTENSIQPISFSVPRRERLKFHGDLYPITTCLAPPSLMAEEWLSGATAPRARVPISPPQHSTSASDATNATTSMDNCVADENVDAIDDSTVDSSGRTMSFGPKLKFRHVYGKESSRDQTWFNLSPSLAAEGPLLTCSSTMWAVPWKGAGGAVFVSRIDQPGKADSTPHVISGHRAPVLDLAFSPFHENILATASDDGHVKLWNIPIGGMQSSMDSNDATSDYHNHTSSVRCLRFHPRTNNLLASSSLDNTVRIWDIEQCKDVCVTNIDLQEGASVTNVDFNYSGYQMLAACKDKTVRFIDPRVGTVHQTTPENSLGRNLRATWCDTPAGGAVVTTFMGPSGRRQIQAWDPRNMQAPQSSQVVDNNSGMLYPIFDEDTGLCLVVGKGDTIIRFYEMSFLSSTFTFMKSCDYSSAAGEPIAGACLLPKQLCDFRNVEGTVLENIYIQFI